MAFACISAHKEADVAEPPSRLIDLAYTKCVKNYFNTDISALMWSINLVDYKYRPLFYFLLLALAEIITCVYDRFPTRAGFASAPIGFKTVIL